MAKPSGGVKSTTVGRPKGAATVGPRVFRQNVTGAQGTAGRMTAVKSGRNKKTK